MAYERHNWECGETITAELLNNIEGGVEDALQNGAKVLTITVETETFIRSEYNTYGSSTGTKKIPIASTTLSEGDLATLMADVSNIEQYDAVVIKLITNTQFSGMPFTIQNIYRGLANYSPSSQDTSVTALWAEFVSVAPDTRAFSVDSYYLQALNGVFSLTYMSANVI